MTKLLWRTCPSQFFCQVACRNQSCPLHECSFAQSAASSGASPPWSSRSRRWMKPMIFATKYGLRVRWKDSSLKRFFDWTFNNTEHKIQVQCSILTTCLTWNYMFIPSNATSKFSGSILRQKRKSRNPRMCAVLKSISNHLSLRSSSQSPILGQPKVLGSQRSGDEDQDPCWMVMALQTVDKN